MFLLVPAYLGSPGQRAVRLLLLYFNLNAIKLVTISAETILPLLLVGWLVN